MKIGCVDLLAKNSQSFRLNNRSFLLKDTFEQKPRLLDFQDISSSSSDDPTEKVSATGKSDDGDNDKENCLPRYSTPMAKRDEVPKNVRFMPDSESDSLNQGYESTRSSL